MGACTFVDIGVGKSATDVFRRMVDSARYEHGHGGYTGTIAEKHDFAMVTCPPRKNPYRLADELMDKEFYDKWGPAGCIELKGVHRKKFIDRKPLLKGKRGLKVFLFFGWASS